jgi:RNA polymerase sigma-70 factor (ECF subfamily)
MSKLAAPMMTTGSRVRELEELFREHYQMLYRTAYSILDNAADAEDVPQTIFLRLLRSEFSPDLQRNPAGYLYRAAVNGSLNIVRTRKRHPFADVDALQIAMDRPASNSAEDAHQRIAEALAELDPESAQILVLRYMHNYSDSAIAKLMGTSRGAMAVRLFRARSRLKKLMRNSLERKQ